MKISRGARARRAEMLKIILACAFLTNFHIYASIATPCGAQFIQWDSWLQADALQFVHR